MTTTTKPALLALPTMTPVRVLDLKIPTKKQRGELIRTTVITAELEGPNELLNLLDRTLLPMLYKAVETPAEHERARQQALEGIEVVASLPMLWTSSIRWPLRLANEYSGYTLTIDRGLGNHTTGGKSASSNVVLNDVAIKGLEVTGKEGGTVKIRLRFLAPNMSDEDIGRVSHFIKRETSIMLAPPQVKQATIDGTTEAFEADQAAKREADGDDPIGDLEDDAPRKAPPRPRAKRGESRPH